MGGALQRPGRRIDVAPGQDVPLPVALDGALQPARLRPGADHDIERVGGHLGLAPAVAQRDPLEPARPGAGDDLGAEPNLDVRCLVQLAHEVVGHAGSQPVAAHDERYRRGRAGQVHGGLPGRVPAADDEGRGTLDRGVERGRTVVDAGPQQLRQRRRLQPVPGDARGDDDRPGAHLGSALQPQDVLAAGAFELDGRPGEDEAGAEEPRLLERAGPQVAARDPVREAEVVADA
jgi:hypothetical protein